MNMVSREYEHVKTRSSCHGFMLIELVVVVAIIAIITMIAAPMIKSALIDMEAKRIKQTIFNTLATAKAESLIRRQNLIVCLSDDHKSCNREASQHLLLFVDSDKNYQYDSGQDTLITTRALDLKYATTHLRVGLKRHYIKFWGNTGKPRGYFGHIKYCPLQSIDEESYMVSFNKNGIIKHKPHAVEDTACGT